MPPRKPKVDDAGKAPPVRRGKKKGDAPIEVKEEEEEATAQTRFSDLKWTLESDAGKEGPSSVEFVIRDVDLCVVNSIRRAIMTQVPSAAMTTSTINILKNTSSLHNEFMAHRISLIPLGFDANALRSFDPKAWKFQIKVKNSGNAVIDVTSRDFIVTDGTGSRVSQAVRDAIFPPSPVTGDHILIACLRPSSLEDGNGEELSIEATAVLGRGEEHARFSLVSRCFFRNKIDQEMADEAFAQSVETSDKEEDVARLRRQFDALEAHRHFKKNLYGDPSEFVFTIDSETRVQPTYLFFKAIVTLIEKVTRVSKAALATDASVVEVDACGNIADFHSITVHREDHTLGNLVQGMLYRKWIRDGGASVVSYIGYYQPHPLEPNIVFKVKCAAPGLDVRRTFSEGLEWIADELHDLAKEFVSAAGFSGIVDVTEFLAGRLVGRGKRAAASMAEVLMKDG